MRQAEAVRVRRGMSLLELLVVLALIAILIALLVPAVQRVRESAGLAECSNNIKQIALAALSFESQQGRLPPGYIGPRDNKTFHTAVAYGDPEDNQWVGHLPLLLSHLEQVDMQKQVVVNLDPDIQGQPWWEPKPPAVGPLPGDYQLATRVLRVFQCPANANDAVPFQAGSTSMGTVVGFHLYTTGPFIKMHRWIENYDDGNGTAYPWQLATSNYFGVCGAGRGTSPWWSQWEGVFTNRSKTKLTDITDGASNTLLYGEAAGRGEVDATTNEVVANSLNVSWFGGGVLPSSGGVQRGQSALWNQFSSHHAQSVRFAFADGSVRAVSFDVPPSVILTLSGMHDGMEAPALQ